MSLTTTRMGRGAPPRQRRPRGHSAFDGGFRVDGLVADPRVDDRRGRGRVRTVARADAAELVAAPPPVPLPRASFLVLVLGIVTVGVAGILVLTTKINENSFVLGDLRAQQAELDLQEQRLRAALTERQSTGNLRAAAVRLGLVPAGNPAYLELPDGRIIGVPEPATEDGFGTAAGR